MNDTRQQTQAITDHAFWQKAKLVATLTGHSKFIRVGAISPDSKIFASGSDDTAVKLWNLETGRLLLTLKGYQGRISAIAFSVDGHLLASAGDYRGINIWDSRTGRLLKTLAEDADDSIAALYFTPDGQQLKSINVFGLVQVWDLKTQKSLQVLKLASYPNDIMMGYRILNLNRATLAIGVYNTSDKPQKAPVMLWDTATGRILDPLPSEGRCNPSFNFSVMFSPDGRSLASGMAAEGSDGKIIQKICIWDVNTKKLHHVLLGHTMGVWGLAFTPDNKLLASGSADGTIRIWDLETGKQRGILAQKLDETTDLVLSPDGKTLVSWGVLNRIRVWRM